MCSLLLNNFYAADGWLSDEGGETQKVTLLQVLEPLLFHSVYSVSEAVEVYGKG